MACKLALRLLHNASEFPAFNWTLHEIEIMHVIMVIWSVRWLKSHLNFVNNLISYCQ